MSSMLFELGLILLLVLGNGAFSMAELAVVSARRARLRGRAADGRRGAGTALELAANPQEFLATVQVGITVIGTLTGAFGGATVAKQLAVSLQQYPALAPQAEVLAISAVVLGISYVTLILGELVPKNLALAHAETLACFWAPPMKVLARIGGPAVTVLAYSTGAVLKLLGVQERQDGAVTEEEVKLLLAEGAAQGSFEPAEREMVVGVFRLGDRNAGDLMQPRAQVKYLDVRQDWARNRAVVRGTAYSRFPVADGGLDRLLGVVHVKDLFLSGDGRPEVDLRRLARKPLFVQETTAALDALAQFQRSGQQMAIVIDEHGGVQGVMTLTDVLDAVVGDLRGPGEPARPGITRREDGTWLADGVLAVPDLVEALGLREVPGGEQGFSTVGGLVLAYLHHIPVPGEHCEVAGWRFEVLDMDGHRIDKVLVSRVAGD